MAETIQSLDQLGTLKPATPEAPKYVQKIYDELPFGGVKSSGVGR